MEHGPVQIVEFLRLFERLGDGWLALVVTGVFAGLLVRFAGSSQRRVGFWSSGLFGVAGALLGLYAAGVFGIALPGPGARFLAALAGSCVLALLGGALARMLRRRKAPQP